MFFKSALLAAGAGLAVAQSLSSSCSSALIAIAASPDATCLDIALLAPLAVSNTTSVIPTVNTWLSGLCSQGPCSNATLQAVVTNITTGCSTDLASLGITTDNSASLVTTVQAAYPTVRQIACLKDTSANTLCATELLTDIQSSSGTTLTLANVLSLVTHAYYGKNITVPQNVTCSNCSKAAYTIATQSYPSLVSGEQSTVQSECGSSFTDGQMPSGIQETAANSTSTSTGGAASLSAGSLHVGVTVLLAVSTTFALFA